MENAPKFDEYLKHHGVKGQRWGVRRTKEQLGYAVSKTKKKIKSIINKVEKNRKAKAKEKEAAKTAAMKAEEAKKIAVEQRKAKEKAVKEYWNKPTYEMTDEELSARIARAQKEIDYKTKMSMLNPATVSYGEKVAKQVLEQYVVPVVGDAFRKTVSNAIEKANKKPETESEKDKLQKEYEILKLRSDINKYKNESKNSKLQKLKDEESKLKTELAIKNYEDKLKNIKKQEKLNK